jgi:hypothetical protein
MTLGRAFGGHYIDITHDPVPEYHLEVFKLNVDGLLFNEHREEYALFSRLFEQLAKPELEHINIHLVIPGPMCNNNTVDFFSATDKSWASLTHRVRSITLDFGAWRNSKSSESAAWVWSHWAYHMLEDSTATRTFICA